jgi:hypothetical protein
MMKLHFLPFVFFALAVNSQVVVSSCVAPDSIVARYWDDACMLSVEHAYKTNSTYKDSIHLNKTWRDRYLRALIAVYNATAIAQRDSVVNFYSVHKYGASSMSSTYFHADTNLLWMKSLRTGNFPCGHSSLDNLAIAHFVKKVSYWKPFSGSEAYVTLDTDTNLNATAFKNALKQIQGITNAYENHLIGDGSRIFDSVTTQYVRLTYQYRWGDCPAGCIYRKNFTFFVYNDCSVSYGTEPVAVGLRHEARPLISVFPNPTKDRFTLQTIGRVPFTILNVLGQRIAEGEAPGEFDLGFAPGGIYLVKTHEGEVTRMIKE